MSLLHYFHTFNSVNLTNFIKLYYHHQHIGWINQHYLTLLAPFPHLFVCRSEIDKTISVHFQPEFINRSLAQRNAQMAQFSYYIKEKEIIHNWRNELYGIYSNNDLSDLLFTIERGVAPFLGLKSYGTHINGYIDNTFNPRMWIAKRSARKKIEPLKLDQIAAGGLTFGESIHSNAIRECTEEASIPFEISKTMTYEGFIEYLTLENHFIRNDRLYIFDLKLPEKFVPAINDHEVDSFMCINCEMLLNELREATNNFKKNSALIVIHFLLRHRIISESDREYFELKQKLNLT